MALESRDFLGSHICEGLYDILAFKHHEKKPQIISPVAPPQGIGDSGVTLGEAGLEADFGMAINLVEIGVRGDTGEQFPHFLVEAERRRTLQGRDLFVHRYPLSGYIINM